MSELKHRLAAALTVTSAAQTLLIMSPAVAQEESVTLEEIVVSAQRREESVTKVPISIAAFTAATIETNQIQSVEDYVSKASNLSISRGATRSGTVSTSSHGLSIR